MSSKTTARKNLNYMDPAAFTPHFAWKKAARGPGREVYCEGVALSDVARKYGTPAYVYSRAAMEEAVDELKAGLHGLPHLICFAVKANGNLSLLKLLAERGCGFDLVSGGELDLVERIGVPGKRIVFSGVGKTREEIRAGLGYKGGGEKVSGILQFNVESAAELEVLLEEAARHVARGGRAPGVSLRVNPDVQAGGHPHISTGLYSHKFGMVWPEARGLYLAHASARQIRWEGISAHIGSQIVGLGPFRTALRRLANYLLELREKGISLQFLDFGGGLGVRYTTEKPASRRAYARMVAQVVKPLGVKLLLEPGRSIVAPAGVLLSRVIYRKENPLKTFVVIDAGMNDFARPVLYDAPHPITAVKQGAVKQAAKRERVDVVGPVCETGDSFLQGWPLDRVQAGDLLAIWGAGAYGMVQASNYNGRGRAAEILVAGQRAKLIRRKERREDLMRTDVLGDR
jgi:diaminopimelate decarboxylase